MHVPSTPLYGVTSRTRPRGKRTIVIRSSIPGRVPCDSMPVRILVPSDSPFKSTQPIWVTDNTCTNKAIPFSQWDQVLVSVLWILVHYRRLPGYELRRCWQVQHDDHSKTTTRENHRTHTAIKLFRTQHMPTHEWLTHRQSGTKGNPGTMQTPAWSTGRCMGRGRNDRRTHMCSSEGSAKYQNDRVKFNSE